MTLVITLAACDDTAAPDDNSQNGSNTNGSAPVSPTGGNNPPPPDEMGGGVSTYTAYNNATQQEKDLGTYVTSGVVEEYGGDTVIFFTQRVNDGYDRIAVLRGSSQNDLTVHEILPKSGFDFIGNYELISRLYIDAGAAGNKYYYAIVGMTDDVIGVPEESNVRQFSKAIAWRRLYKGDSGYVQVAWEHIERSFETYIPVYRSIEVYDSDGHYRFYADSGHGNIYENGQMAFDHIGTDRLWQSVAWVGEQHIYPRPMIFFDYSDTAFTFYGVTEDGHSDTFYPEWPVGEYTFTVY